MTIRGEQFESSDSSSSLLNDRVKRVLNLLRCIINIIILGSRLKASVNKHYYITLQNH